MSENPKVFLGDQAVKTVTLLNWMTWASGQPNAPHNVVLPMIQRGSVWSPHKVTDLWDTLLRGMPVGAMMASDIKGEAVQNLDVGGTSEAKLGDIGLIDGQQRTLSMLAGWPGGLKKPSRALAIWLDLFDEPQAEYWYRLWATTRSQPFGYTRVNIGGQPLNKLERNKLRLANHVFCPSAGKIDAQALWRKPDFMPWESKFAIALTELIENRANLRQFVYMRLTEYKSALDLRRISAVNADAAQVAEHFAKKLRELPNADDATLAQRIAALEKALEKLIAYEFPVIHVRQESYSNHDQSPKVNADPPLAILFKRVGTGGEPLSNADYVYAVIKNHSDKVHDTVEKLLIDQKISAVYTPTTLVMSAVRLTMFALNSQSSQGQKLNDSAKLDKAAFARMVRSYPKFLEQFESHIQPDGIFATGLKQVLATISYTEAFPKGLPKHALCLLQIPLLEVILAWCTQYGRSEEAMERSSLAMVRFLLQGNLCVLDYARASEVAIKALGEHKFSASETFPDQALLDMLAAGDKPLAHPFPSPETLSAVDGLTSTPNGINGLVGWTRFAGKGESQKYADLYKRWWNRTGRHAHPMLLWLQREYVFNNFEEEPALAGMEDETPFDFDHILPSAQWANWTGSGQGNRLVDFPIKEGKTILDASGHWHVGNSIGNIHALDSSKNRELGEMSVMKKLKIDGFAKNALINDEEHLAVWNAASESEKNPQDPRNWDEHRALSFQKAVEQRTFALYQKFYGDLQDGTPSFR